MPRPKSTEELKDYRFQMMMKQSEVEAIDDWMFSRRLRSRAEAIRQLVDLGLKPPYGVDADEMVDKIDGLSSDLDEAVRIAFKYGATDWVKMNYPALYENFTRE